VLPDFKGTPEPKAAALLKVMEAVKGVVTKVAEQWGYETLTDDDDDKSAENQSSVVLCVEIEQGKYVLLTSDAGIAALTDVVNRLETDRFDFSTLNFVQVPHHGSHHNIGPSLLDRLIGSNLPQEGIKRKTAFVSVSKDAPKHPSRKVTNAFLRRGAPVVATQGTIKYHFGGVPLRAGWE
jgi:beta-lactamase superfamily II metal-dependent hydrolase